MNCNKAMHIPRKVDECKFYYIFNGDVRGLAFNLNREVKY